MLGLFLVCFFYWGILPVSVRKLDEAAVKRSLLLPSCLFCPPPLLRPRCCRPAAVCGCERWPWMSAGAPCPGSCGSVGRRAAAGLAVNGEGERKGHQSGWMHVWSIRKKMGVAAAILSSSSLLMIPIKQNPPPPILNLNQRGGYVPVHWQLFPLCLEAPCCPKHQSVLSHRGPSARVHLRQGHTPLNHDAMQASWQIQPSVWQNLRPVSEGLLSSQYPWKDHRPLYNHIPVLSLLQMCQDSCISSSI